jgi:hypothetical protein
MKANKCIWGVLALAFLAAGAPSLSAQSKKEREQQKQEAVRKTIASEAYKIDVDMALPMSGRNIPLTSLYSLAVRGDSVISYLPYFGRGYTLPYGGGKGLNFSAPLKDYSMEMNKKGTASIRFGARTDEDVYDFRIKVFSNGSASIDVTMQNRQSISFQGKMISD